LVTSPCVWVGKAHVLKHKLRTGSWVILTGNRPLCMGGCGVRGIFSACMRKLLLNIISWGGHSSTGRVFFRQWQLTYYLLLILVSLRSEKLTIWLAYFFRVQGQRRGPNHISKRPCIRFTLKHTHRSHTTHRLSLLHC
jgi:hypothetical protein